MAFFTIYEPQYLFTGWVDDGGMAMASWLDRDLAADSSGTIIKLAEIDAGAAGMFTDDVDPRSIARSASVQS
jgi:hypothetical protein